MAITGTGTVVGERPGNTSRNGTLKRGKRLQFGMESEEALLGKNEPD